ncbi:putative methyltransferase-domain-containing protein [Obelidium mucronatum]|nr:putative methyltransferase-domain-containing protein [Obelidium mucronatum]
MAVGIALELQRLTRQFLQCTPLRHFEFGSIGKQLDSACQTQILTATLNHPLAQKYPPSISYTTKFLKNLIARIEEQKSKDSDDESMVGVCNEDLLETYMEYLMMRAPSDEIAYRSYSMSIESDQSPLFITLAEAEQTISNGTTGLRTWPAALSLVSYLISEKRIGKSSLRTVELGCGVGLVGIACGLLGVASSVEFTDTDSVVLGTVARNCAINFTGTEVKTTVARLDWETISDSDLNSVVNSSAAELIVASDVAYDPVIVPPFVRVLTAFLRRPTCDGNGNDRIEALVATTRRAESTFDLFLEQLKQNALNYDVLQVPNLNLYYFDEPGQIDLMRIYAK